MRIFYDTSAWVPLLMRESATDAMQLVRKEVAETWAWAWMQVETEAALTRRRANPACWRNWLLLKTEVCWVDIAPDQYDVVCAFNRAIGLRAADAGHLFVFDRILSELPDLQLLTLDSEMATAAQSIGLPLHPASTPR
jgi:uncharacterized protein with PIN domain